MSYKKLFLLLCLGIFISYGKNGNAQTQTFNYTGALQTWTVPCATVITITANGAQGGTCVYGTGGLGATITGTFAVVPGQVLDVLVGQGGTGGPQANNYFYCGSGGGGTYVWNSNSSALPMIVAGGGGGGSDNGNGSAGAGSATQTATPAVGGQGSVAGGTGGNGGAAGGWSGSGAGWLTNGGNGSEAGGGQTPGNGGAGGTYVSPGWTGGYGGGGGCDGNNGAGGGGGGYNGGGAGIGGGNWGSGGGGGSYNAGTNPTAIAGNWSGNGSVVITWTVSNLPVTCTGVVYQNENTCNGQTGAAYAKVTGVGLSYSWTPSGGTRDTASNLSAGTYIVTVNSLCGGSASASVTITQPPNVVTASTVVNANVLCNGGNNGSATVTINGAGTPYTYAWLPVGQITATANGLTAGVYTVVVANVCGASASAQVIITQPAPLSITASTMANIPCYGDNNGTVLGKANSGTPPYTYAWSPTGGNLAAAAGLAPGIYTVTLTDNNGCTGSARTTVTQPAAPLTTAITAITNVLCNAGSTGSIGSSTAGGTLPYTYSWTGGQTNAMANALTAGSYTLNITDANGCKVSAAATVSQPAAITVTKMVTPDDGGCTGSAWVMVNGGVIPYTYAWSNGNTTAYDHNICGQDSSYCCKITDANGCSESACVTVDNDAGVANISSASGKVTVYPNPTSGQFTIQLSAFSSQWSVEVYNVLGEKVYSQSSIQNATSNINVGNQPNGVYLYRIVSSTNGNMIGQGKIVLEK